MGGTYKERLARAIASGTEAEFLKQRASWSAKWCRTKHGRRYHLKSKYGLSVEVYDAMLRSQFGRCAICFLEPTSGKLLHVDHCHETGKIRGLLCRECNLAVGLFQDHALVVDAAHRYLVEHEEPLVIRGNFREWLSARGGA